MADVKKYAGVNTLTRLIELIKQNMPKGATSETLTIQSSAWTDLSDSLPFTKSATVAATTTLSNDSTIELLNDQPVLFANYGFAIGAVSGQDITFYAIKAPVENTNLSIEVN